MPATDTPPRPTEICARGPVKKGVSPAEAVVKEFRDAPPTHYTFKIQSFSLLSKSSMERYDTTPFEAGGYKWKLSLYPNGDQKKNVKEHMSLYLIISEANFLPLGWEVNVAFRLFLFDQVRDKYMTIEDTRENVRFHGMKTRWGFPKFIDLETFTDPSNGYLIDDACVFGAEVFVCKERSRGIGECLSMIEGATAYTHTWRILNLLDEKNPKECLESETFMAGSYKWKIQLYPNGFGEGKGNSLSMYLALADSAALPIGRKLYVDFTLRLMDKNRNKRRQATDEHWFSVSNNFMGWEQFLQFSSIGNQKEICIVEAEVTVLGVVDKLT